MGMSVMMHFLCLTPLLYVALPVTAAALQLHHCFVLLTQHDCSVEIVEYIDCKSHNSLKYLPEEQKTKIGQGALLWENTRKKTKMSSKGQVCSSTVLSHVCDITLLCFS